MKNRKHVALLIETLNAYARGLLEGVNGFVPAQEPWSALMKWLEAISRVFTATIPKPNFWTVLVWQTHLPSLHEDGTVNFKRFLRLLAVWPLDSKRNKFVFLRRGENQAA